MGESALVDWERAAPGETSASSLSGGVWGKAIRRSSLFDKTERGMACDEDFYAEHEVFGYVIRHRWRTSRRIVKFKKGGGIECGSPEKKKNSCIPRLIIIRCIKYRQTEGLSA